MRHTERYQVRGVLDSRRAGQDAGEVLDGKPCGIPVLRDLPEALARLGPPDHLVVGIAPDGGRLPPFCRPAIAAALRAGISVDSGLHDLLSEDPEFLSLAAASGARIRDVRRPPDRGSLHFFTGRIDSVGAPRVAVLGTDSAVGKRTTAVILTRALRARGVAAEMIGTGQTSWFQGARYGIILDSIINDFVTGEIEDVILRASEEVRPEVLILEGQGSLTNPAYPGGYELLAAGRPRAIVLQHAPGRSHYDGFPQYPLGSLEREIRLLELLAQCPVVALTLNHEGLTREDLARVQRDLEGRHGLPAMDVLWEGPDRLVEAVLDALPGCPGRGAGRG